MVANRCIAPYSKLYCYEQWLKEDIYFPDGKDMELQHFYRAMDFLEAHKEGVEKAVFWKLADLFNLDVDIIFYDTTTVSIVVGMAVTRDGLPVRSWVFPGNTVDVKTIAQVKSELKG